MNITISFNYNLEDDELRILGTGDCYLVFFEDSSRRQYLLHFQSKKRAIESLKDKRGAICVYVDKYGLVRSRKLYKKLYQFLLNENVEYEWIYDVVYCKNQSW